MAGDALRRGWVSDCTLDSNASCDRPPGAVACSAGNSADAVAGVQLLLGQDVKRLRRRQARDLGYLAGGAGDPDRGRIGSAARPEGDVLAVLLRGDVPVDRHPVRRDEHAAELSAGGDEQPVTLVD